MNVDHHQATAFQAELASGLAFIAPNATVIGHVEIGHSSSVWFGTVIRGDSDKIIIGSNTNIQDLSVVHTDAGIQCEIGDRVTVGHNAIVHGAKVMNDVLIGMRSVVMNRAVVGSGSIIAPGAIVTEGTEIPANSVVMGVPGKVVRKTTEADHQRITAAWQHYAELGRIHREMDR